MELVIDSREQLPYADYFRKLELVHKTKKLDVGDYSIKGYESEFAIERKTKEDFIQSITTGRARFARELKRAQNYKFFSVIIEASFYDFMNHNYRSSVHPSSVIGTIVKWSVKYNTQFLLVDSRSGGALCVIKLAEAFLKYKIYDIGEHP